MGRAPGAFCFFFVLVGVSAKNHISKLCQKYYGGGWGEGGGAPAHGAALPIPLYGNCF